MQNEKIYSAFQCYNKAKSKDYIHSLVGYTDDEENKKCAITIREDNSNCVVDEEIGDNAGADLGRVRWVRANPPFR